MKRLRNAALCAVLALCVMLTGALAEGGASGLDYLAAQLERPARLMMEQGEDVDDIYSELWSKPGIAAFPEQFDLRALGRVTPVKRQNPWGTCWSFGTIAASESSILSMLGLTCDEYEAQYGEPMDPELYDILVTPPEILEKCEMYENLPPDARALYNRLWIQLGL